MANNINFNVGFNTDLSGLKQVKSALEELKSLTVADAMDLNKSLNPQQAGKELKKVKQIVNEIETALNQSFNTNLNTTNITKFNQALNNIGIDKITQSFSKFGAVGDTALTNIATKSLTAGLQLQKTTSALETAGEELYNTGKWFISSSIINRLADSVQESIGYVKALDHSLNDIRIVTGASADEMDKFAIKANKAAKSLGAATTDYTNAALIYRQQGLGEEETAARAETTLKMQNVTGLDAAQASEYVTSIVNGYQVATEDTEAAIDKLAGVAAMSASNLEELATGMSKVASAASTMGVTEDQLVATMSTIISVTRQAPESVGTALKTIYARMGDLKLGETDEDGVQLGEVSGQLSKIGVEVLDVNGNMRDMGTIVEETANKWQGMSQAEKEAVAVALAGKRQYNNLFALFENWDMYQDALNASANSLGTLENQQSIYLEGTEAHLQSMKTSFENLYDSILDEKTINNSADVFGKIADNFANFVDSIGGGSSLLTGFVGIFTSLANSKITKELSNITQNFLNSANNAKILREEIMQTQAWANSQGMQNAGVKELVERKKEVQKYYNVLDNEQIEAANGYAKELAFLADERSQIENNTKSAMEYAEALLDIESAKRNRKIGTKEQRDTINQVKADPTKILDKNIEGQVQTISTKFSQISKNIVDEIKNIQNNINNLVTGGKFEYGESLNPLITKLKEISTQGKITDGDLQKIINTVVSVGQGNKSFDSLNNQLLELRKNGKITQDEYKKLIQIFNEKIMSSNLEAEAKKLEKLINSIREGNKKGVSIVDEEILKSAEEKLEKIKNKQKSINQNGSKTKDTLTKNQELLEAIKKLINDIEGKTEEFNSNLNKTPENLNHINEETQRIKNSFNNIIDTAAIESKIKSVVSGLSAISSISFGITSLKGIFDIDEDLTTGEKLLTLMTNIGMGLPMLMNGFTELGKAFGYNTNLIGGLASTFSILTATQKENIKALGFEITLSKIIKGTTVEEILTKKGLNGITLEQIALLNDTTKAELKKVFADEAEIVALQELAKKQMEVNASMLSNPVLLGIAAAIMVVVGVITIWEKAEEKRLEAVKETAEIELERIEKLKEEANAYQEASNSLQDLLEQYKKGEITKEEFRISSLQLVDSLGLEAVAAINAADSYEEATKKLAKYQKQKAEEQIKNNENQAKENLKIIGAELGKNKRTDYDDDNNKLSYTTRRYNTISNSGNFINNLNSEELEKYGLSKISQSQNGVGTETVGLEISIDMNDPEKALEQIENLKLFAETNKDNLGETVYQDIIGFISDFTNSDKYQEIQNSIAEIEVQAVEAAGKGSLIAMAKSKEEAEEQYNNFIEILKQYQKEGKIGSDVNLDELAIGWIAQNASDNTYAIDVAQNNVSKYNKTPEKNNNQIINDNIIKGTGQGIPSYIEHIPASEQKKYKEVNLINKNNKDKYNYAQKVKENLIEQGYSEEELASLTSLDWENIANNMTVDSNYASAAGDKIADPMIKAYDYAKNKIQQKKQETAKTLGETDVDADDNSSISRKAADSLQDKVSNGYVNEDNIDKDSDFSIIKENAESLISLFPHLESEYSAVLNNSKIGTDEWNNSLQDVGDTMAILSGANMDVFTKEDAVQKGIDSLDRLRDARERQIITEEDYKKMESAVADAEAEKYDYTTEELDNYQAEMKKAIKTQDNMGKSTEELEEYSKDLALTNARLEKGLSDISKNWKTYAKALKSSDEKEKAKAVTELQKSLMDVFDLQGEEPPAWLDKKFIEDNQDLIEDAANGVDGAMQKLSKAAGEAQINKLKIEVDDSDVQAKFDNLNALANQLPDYEVGASLDDTDFINACNEMLASGEMTVDEMQDYLNSLGFTPDIQYEEAKTSSTLKAMSNYQGYLPSDAKQAIAENTVEASVQIPYINAKGTIKKSSAPRRSSSGGGGGGGGSKPSTSEGQNQEAFEDDIDIYHQINTQIDKTTAALERLQNQQEKLSGKNLLNNIKAQIRLNQQLVNQQTAKLKLQQKEAQVLKTQLLSLDSRLKLNKDGTIGNYDQLLSQRVNEINAKIEEYNALYGDGKELSEDQQKAAEAMEKEIERMKGSYQDLKDMMDQYDEMISQTIADTKAAIADAANQEIQLKIDAFSKSIEIKLEINELKRELNEFVAEVTKVSLKYGKDLIKDIKSEIAGARSYVIGNKSDYNVNVQGYKRAQADFNAIQKGKAGKVYGNDAAAALEAMQQYAQGALEALQNAYDAVQSLKEGYIDFIDTIGEAYDEQKEQYDYINSSIEHQINLIQKLKGENAYDDLNKAYTAQINNSIGSVDMYKQQVAYYDKIAADYAKRFGTDSEQYKAVIKAQQEAKANLESSIDEALEYVQVRFENTIDKIANKGATALATMNPEVLAAQWENYKTEEARYLDPLSRTYQVGNFADNVKKEIDKTDNIRFQQELNNLLNEEIARMEKIDKLSQNEVDYANLRLQLKLKELALEEAKENKTKMRLKRDSQGNYSYVYTADEDNIAKAQEEYKKAAKDLYDRLVKDKQSYEDEYVSATNNFANEYAEIAKRTDISEEDRAKLLDELKEKYTKIFEDIKRKEESLIPQLKDAAAEYAISMGEISRDFWNSLTDDEKAKYYDKWIGDKLDNTAAKSIKEAIASGDFIGYLNSVIDDTDKAIKEKSEAINDIGDAAGIDNLADTDTAIQNLAQSTQILTDSNAELATNLDKTKKSLDKLYKSMSDLIKFVDGKGFENAIKKIKSFYSAVNNANSTNASALNTASYEQISQTVASYIHQTNGMLELNDMPTLKAKSKSYSDASLTNNPVTHNNQIYGKVVDIKGDAVKLENIGWVNKKDLVKGSFDTGGYTGEWDDRKGGRIAMLHSKELVLNKYDTSNFLKALQVMRDLYTEGRKIKLQEQIQTQIKGLTNVSNNNEAQELNQNVKIEANFPNVRDASEIERALNNLVNTANQYIWKN